MLNSYLLLILLFIRILLTSARYRRDDKLVLDAVNLIDLIREEESSYKHSEEQEEESRPVQESPYNGLKSNLVTVVSDLLKQRKVWSKWSKWSPCSVTCGNGAAVRQRRCAAGRCASGEREVQVRPCSRPPCDFVSPEDSHDWDS